MFLEQAPKGASLATHALPRPAPGRSAAGRRLDTCSVRLWPCSQQREVVQIPKPDLPPSVRRHPTVPAPEGCFMVRSGRSSFGSTGPDLVPLLLKNAHWCLRDNKREKCGQNQTKKDRGQELCRSDRRGVGSLVTPPASPPSNP